MTQQPLDVLIAPDSFKGSLTSVEVARALADGWHCARPGDRVELAPLADGGQGTLVAIEAAGGWEWRETEVHGPDFAPVRAKWLSSPDGRSAVIEMAEAAGLSLIPSERRRTTDFTSMGTGELIRAAIDAGARDITLGIGGSATTDGGAGILTVLGVSLRDADGRPLAEPPNPPVAIALSRVTTVDLSRLDPRLAQVELQIACDVTNPLLGSDGAAAIYGPQKGASPDDVEVLDSALATYGNALEAATGRRERATPGAGAAGGVGFGLLCLTDHFRSLELVPGVDVVMAAADLAGKLERADLVITGEGRIDAQTAFGKTALGVARAAKAAGVPCIAVGGGVEPGGIEALADLAIVVPVVERPMSGEEAMSAGPGPLERCGERLARLVGLAS
ncbi:MAG: glycerate kinase [Chloroflexi bacterium]|nr:glycerate kinase [Chloroflexota bacterium]